MPCGEMGELIISKKPKITYITGNPSCRCEIQPRMPQPLLTSDSLRQRLELSIKQMSDKTPNAYKWLLCKQWNDGRAGLMMHPMSGQAYRRHRGGEGAGELFLNGVCKEGCFWRMKWNHNSHLRGACQEEWFLPGLYVIYVKGQSEKCMSRVPWRSDWYDLILNH